MNHSLFFRAHFFLAAAGFLTVGCGEQASQEELLAALQLETPPCTATFTEALELKDNWGDSLFTTAIGDTFIVADIRDWGGTIDAEFYYLADNGAYGFDFAHDTNDVSTLPFELSCPIDATQSYLGAFNTVVVYRDEALSQEACTLERGASAAVGVATGHRLVSELFAEPMVYEVELAGFADTCGGIPQGYVEADSSRIFGSITSLIPILRYQTPLN